ncbi:hypothetical protein CR513_29932, partial [Mucuna pruriens]
MDLTLLSQLPTNNNTFPYLKPWLHPTLLVTTAEPSSVKSGKGLCSSILMSSRPIKHGLLFPCRLLLDASECFKEKRILMGLLKLIRLDSSPKGFTKDLVVITLKYFLPC